MESMPDDFVFDWTKQLGFKKNPFSPEAPKKVNDFFAGLGEERKKLNLFFLEKYDFGTITGVEGSGKTMMLRWIRSQLGKHSDKVRISYIDASKLETERDLIKAISEPVLNVYEKTIAKKQEKLKIEEIGKFLYSKLKGEKRLLILLDNVGALPKRYIGLFKYFFNNKIGVQLIAAGTEKEISDSNIMSVSEKDNLKIELDGLSYKDMKDLLEKRIRQHGQENIFPFKEDMIKQMHRKSGGNPRKFLEMCRQKAINLALDKDYMKEQWDVLEEEKRKRLEEEEQGDAIAIRFGKKEDAEEKPKEVKMVDAPDMTEQQEMLAEIVGKKPEKKVKEETKEAERPPDIELDFETLEVKEKGESAEEVKEEKKSRKEIKEEKKAAKEAEELLAQLTREFENS